MKHKQLYIVSAALVAVLSANITFAHSGHLHYFFKQPIKFFPQYHTPQNLRPYLRAQVSGTDFNQNVILSEADLWGAYNNVKKTIEALWAPLNGIGQEHQNTIINNLKEIVKPGRFNPSDKQERLTVNQLLLWSYQQIINQIGFIGASKNLPDERKRTLINELAQTTNNYFKVTLVSTKQFTDDFQKPTQTISGLVSAEDGVWGFAFSSIENKQLNKCANAFAKKIVPAAVEKSDADRLTLLQFAAWANSTIDKGLQSLQDSKDIRDADKEKKVSEITAKYCELPNGSTAMKDLEPNVQAIYALTQIAKPETSLADAAPAPAAPEQKTEETVAPKITPPKTEQKPAKKPAAKMKAAIKKEVEKEVKKTLSKTSRRARIKK